jgi:hypothetical protein
LISQHTVQTQQILFDVSARGQVIAAMPTSKSLQSVNKKPQAGSETAKYPLPQRVAGIRGFHSDTFLIAEWT